MSVLDNLGYLSKGTYFPCATPDPILVLQAAGKAAFPVLMSAATFGCNDIVKMRAGISPWHSRGMKALINGAILPDDPYNTKGLLKYTIPIEKALFFWFVVDLTTDFAANWQSQIFKLNACGNSGPNCTWTGSFGSYVEPVANAYVPISYSFTGGGTGCPAAAGTRFIVPANWYWSAHFSLTVEALVHNIHPGSTTLHLRQTFGGTYEFKGDPQTAPWFGNNITTSMLVEPDDPWNRLTSWEFTAACDTVARGKSGTATVTMSPQPVRQRGIIPLNCLGFDAPASNFVP